MRVNNQFDSVKGLWSFVTPAMQVVDYRKPLYLVTYSLKKDSVQGYRDDYKDRAVIGIATKEGRSWYTLEVVLGILAHELAHLKYSEHDHRHWTLMVDIMKVWSYLIKSNEIDTQMTWGQYLKRIKNRV